MIGPEPDAFATAAADPPTRALDLVQAFDRSSLYSLRAAVAAHASAFGVPDDTFDVILIVIGELAGNAVRHGGGGGTLRLRHLDGMIACEVHDTGPGLADPCAGSASPPPGAYGGRGLWIVRQLSERMTVDTGPDGTTVTAMIPLIQ